MDKGPSCPAVHWFGAAAGTLRGTHRVCNGRDPIRPRSRARLTVRSPRSRGLFGIEVMPRHMMDDVKIPGWNLPICRDVCRAGAGPSQTGVSRRPCSPSWHLHLRILSRESRTGADKRLCRSVNSKPGF